MAFTSSFFCKNFCQVPSYSPGSIAEYAIAQIMALAKNTHMSYVMTKKANFEVTSMQVKIYDTGEDVDCDGHVKLGSLLILIPPNHISTH